MSYCQNCADLTRALFEARAQLDAVERSNNEMRGPLLTLSTADPKQLAAYPEMVRGIASMALRLAALAPKAPRETEE